MKWLFFVKHVLLSSTRSPFSQPAQRGLTRGNIKFHGLSHGPINKKAQFVISVPMAENRIFTNNHQESPDIPVPLQCTEFGVPDGVCDFSKLRCCEIVRTVNKMTPREPRVIFFQKPSDPYRSKNKEICTDIDLHACSKLIYQPFHTCSSSSSSSSRSQDSYRA